MLRSYQKDWLLQSKPNCQIDSWFQSVTPILQNFPKKKFNTIWSLITMKVSTFGKWFNLKNAFVVRKQIKQNIPSYLNLRNQCRCSSLIRAPRPRIKCRTKKPGQCYLRGRYDFIMVQHLIIYQNTQSHWARHCREQKLLFNSNAESLLAVSENISLIYFAGEKIDTRYSIDDYLLRPCWKRTMRYNLILVFVNRRFVKAKVNNT